MSTRHPVEEIDCIAQMKQRERSIQKGEKTLLEVLVEITTTAFASFHQSPDSRFKTQLDNCKSRIDEINTSETSTDLKILSIVKILVETRNNINESMFSTGTLSIFVKLIWSSSAAEMIDQLIDAIQLIFKTYPNFIFEINKSNKKTWKINWLESSLEENQKLITAAPIESSTLMSKP